MDNNLCPLHSVHDDQLKKLDKDVDDLNEKVHDIDKKFDVMQSEVSASLKALEGLPGAIATMTNTMLEMNGTLQSNVTQTETLSKDVNALSAKVEAVEEKDKISLIDYLKKNWVSIVAGLALMGYLFADMVKGAIS